ncbi:fumarylacetoacetate hydrolase family protein [candidate division KSB1 bacterium]|nr:fumarylacetoacetate hydrolase family protein [candidate division KSB1 bacterium]
MGTCSADAVERVLSDSWVQSKIHRLRIEENVDFDLPIHRPSKIVAIGRNYKDHVKELDHTMPDEPLFFSKATSSLLPHNGVIQIPDWLEGRVDYEGELGLVIGSTCKDVDEDHAMSVLAGYTIINDVTARDMQKSDMDQGNPWFRSKSLDTFCPAGPYLVPADAVDDPQDLDLTLKVNGEIKQQANTSMMIFTIPKLISAVSRFMTLHPGDMIATGTPSGVGALQDGDEVEVNITGLGTLKNSVRRSGS